MGRFQTLIQSRILLTKVEMGMEILFKKLVVIGTRVCQRRGLVTVLTPLFLKKTHRLTARQHRRTQIRFRHIPALPPNLPAQLNKTLSQYQLEKTDLPQ